MATAQLGAGIAALGAALSWAIGQIFVRRGLARGGTARQATVTVTVVDFTVFALVLSVTAGPAHAADGLGPVGLLVLFLAAVTGVGLARVISNAGVDRVGASVNTAAVSTKPFFAIVFAVLILGERLTPPLLAGATLIVAGVASLSLSRGGNRDDWESAEIAIPLLAATLYGLSDVLRRIALVRTDLSLVQTVATYELMGVLSLVGVLWYQRGDVPFATDLRTNALFATGGVFNAGNIALYFFALQIGVVSTVSTLNSVAPFFVAILSVFFLRDLERVTPAMVAGTAMIVVGTAVILLS